MIHQPGKSFGSVSGSGVKTLIYMHVRVLTRNKVEPPKTVMDNTKMKEKVGKSQVADLSIQETNPKKKQKLSESQVIPRPSLSKFDLVNAIENQNDVAMCLAGKVISTLDKNTNLVFSPASINAVLIMAATRPEEEETLRA